MLEEERAYLLPGRECRLSAFVNLQMLPARGLQRTLVDEGCQKAVSTELEEAEHLRVTCGEET